MNKKNAKLLQVKQSSTLLETLQVIDQGGKEIAYVVDQTDRVVGTVTDGDIRRGLLRSVSLEAPVSEVANPHFTSVLASTTPEEAIEIMLSKTFNNLPILDKDKRLVGYYCIQDLLQTKPLPNCAVIVAGGKGTRLRPLTNGLPKPMLPIGDKPLLERTLVHLISHGIRRVYISIGYLGKMIEDYFGDGQKWGVEISYLREDAPLGTAGCLSLIEKLPKEPVLVMNGDLLTRLHIGRFLDYHERSEHVGTIGVHKYEVQVPFGVIESENQSVQNIVEKPTLTYQVNAGIYVLNPSLLSRLEVGRPKSMTELFQDALAEQLGVGTYSIQEEWVDVGVPSQYFSHHSTSALSPNRPEEKIQQ